MKKIVLMMLLLATGSVFAAATKVQPMTLVEARTGIGEAVTDPAKVTATMKRLSPKDQVAYVAALNAAISKLPGSAAERVSIYLNVNSAAVLGATKGNLKAVVAEVFATAAVESLPAIHSQFAEKFFNRAGNPAVTYSDAQFVKISGEVMKSVNERMTSVDNGDVRSTFAALMFLKASNTPNAPDMIDAVVQMLPSAIQEKAKTEWIPEAVASEPSYDNLTASVDAGEDEITEVMIITIGGPQNHVALFGDLTADFDDQVIGTITDVVYNPLQNATAPFGVNDTDIPDLRGGEFVDQRKKVTEGLEEIDEPGGYQWQRIR